ncbi:hypothetical protein SPRG_06026 [Saprolegnia parasitica CBS 223.65]|uniref:Uncharacterized protein n=1 Tax=Saprolegnia parasitica (strain CBS 223.65) TaxID=695850 RepID=A0A067CRP6_SAPPC|nr:hypothetical protein SPRG_06026 [Saprolegnia parasitica CBS 223.65]KDO29487.1 hypothetical protein SPRG_06026 [Saprolegnia parasitica CBS 223.65]|eukprot:XP_012199983.1 hypothetical protein SPRG_06026 [Saprolegnia parasitica CBS 223.65]
MADFFACWAARATTLALLADAQRDAVANAATELAAAICIQRIFRGQRVRASISRMRTAEILIARVFRGHLGRHKAQKARRRRRHLEKQARFHHLARLIQTRYRGYYSRQHVHNFATRKTYLRELEAKGNALRATVQKRLDEQRALELVRVEEESRDELVKITQNLHHLVGTTVTPGVYSSPFAQARPTAFGVPVETHIRTNTLNLLSTVPKKLLTKQQLKPQPPAVRTSIQASSKYNIDRVYDERDKRYQKAMNFTQDKFVPVVHPAKTYSYDKSINNGISYLDPRKHPFCERSANKSPIKPKPPRKEVVRLPPAVQSPPSTPSFHKPRKTKSKTSLVE